MTTARTVRPCRVCGEPEVNLHAHAEDGPWGPLPSPATPPRDRSTPAAVAAVEAALARGAERGDIPTATLARLADEAAWVVAETLATTDRVSEDALAVFRVAQQRLRARAG
jgi:hypothetical protein